MKKTAQIVLAQPATPDTEVSETPNVNPDNDPTKIMDKDLKKKELDFKQKQLEFIQQEIESLQQQVNAQLLPQNQPAGPQMQELDRLEDQEHDDQAAQQAVDMANQLMQQNQQMNQQMNTLTQNMTQFQSPQTPHVASRWILPERTDLRVALNKAEVVVDVAATPRQKQSGLQAYRSLPQDRALWFPFVARRTATFHMGDVKFPIDIVFIDNDKISKIVHNVQPRQMGSWSAICTDVLELNAGFCLKNQVRVGDKIATPLFGKKRAVSEIERLINTSWSGPQKARITSDIEAADSFDTLRSITTADAQGLTPEEEASVIATFPFLRSAQEHRQPDTTDRRSPGEIDGRNPTDRFNDRTLPDEFSTSGDGGSTDIDPFDNPNLPADGQTSSDYGKHFEMQLGYDPVTFRMEDLDHAMRPSAQTVRVDTPEDNSGLAGIDKNKLASSFVRLFDDHTPDWQDYDQEEHAGRNYDKFAVVNDQTISNWIDGLGFDPENEAKLRKVCFTDESKHLLGDALISAGRVVDYELFDSDLLLYQ